MCNLFNRHKQTNSTPDINFQIINTVLEWKGKRFVLNRIPGFCPYCKSKTHWEGVWLEENNRYLSVILRCSDIECHGISFFIYQKHASLIPSDANNIDYTYCLSYALPKEMFQEKSFSNLIKNLSPNFIDLYHQAEQAEIKANTEKIAGIGFRKALEFLIKDYLISTNPKDEENIKSSKLMLGPAINNYCHDESLKEVFNSTKSLGNDEAHYIRCWKEYDIKDLKELINICVGKIEDIIKTNDYCQKITKENNEHKKKQ